MDHKEQPIETFGQALRSIRITRGITQRAVANALGMDTAYYSRTENGKNDYNPSLNTILLITERLNCNDIEKARLLTSAGRLDPKLRELVIKAQKRPEVIELIKIAVKLPKKAISRLLSTIESKEDHE